LEEKKEYMERRRNLAMISPEPGNFKEYIKDYQLEYSERK